MSRFVRVILAQGHPCPGVHAITHIERSKKVTSIQHGRSHPTHVGMERRQTKAPTLPHERATSWGRVGALAWVLGAVTRWSVDSFWMW